MKKYVKTWSRLFISIIVDNLLRIRLVNNKNKLEAFKKFLDIALRLNNDVIIDIIVLCIYLTPTN